MTFSSSNDRQLGTYGPYKTYSTWKSFKGSLTVLNDIFPLGKNIWTSVCRKLMILASSLLCTFIPINPLNMRT